MAELFEALGVNIKALLIQGANFVILLVVLTFAVYRPLLKIVKERRAKIELGVRGGEMAATKIAEAEQIKSATIRDAESQAVVMINQAEAQGQKRSQEIVHGGEKKAEYIIEEALATAAKKKQEEMEKVALEAQALVKQALIKTVELGPEQVDEKLIHKALQQL